MPTQSKATLKTYFVSNATPDEAEFGHLIDSNLNLAETGEQICVGTISASALNAESYNLNAFSYSDILITKFTESNTFGNSTDDIHQFTGSLHQSGGAASYFLNNLSVGTTSSFQRLSVSGSLFLNGSGHITASGNISSSGTLISDEIQTFGHITASGDISSSGTVLTKFLQLPQATGGTNEGAIHFGGTADDNGFIYDDGSYLILGYDDSDHLKIGKTSPEVEVVGDLRVTNHITASGNISSSGTITANSFVGSLTTTGFDLDDNNKIKFGTGDDLQIFHDGSNSYISQSGVGNLIIGNEDKNIQIKGPVEFLSATGESHNDPTLTITANRSLSVSGSIIATGSIDINNNTPNDNSSVGFQSYGHEYSFYCKGADDFSGYYLQNNGNKFIIKTDGKGTADNGGGNGRAEANFFEYSSNQNNTDPPYRGVIRLRVPSSHFNQTPASMEVIDAYHLKQNVASSGTNTKHLRVGIGDINGESSSTDITLHVHGKVKHQGVVEDSDERLKENIKPLESQLNNIKQLKPSRFDWKDQTKSRYTDDVGFIAQEIRNILPILVTGDESEGDMLSVDYSKLTPILVKALQEQQEIIESLTKRIEDLENK